jgi:hypothetical protein
MTQVGFVALSPQITSATKAEITDYEQIDILQLYGKDTIIIITSES